MYRKRGVLQSKPITLSGIHGNIVLFIWIIGSVLLTLSGFLGLLLNPSLLSTFLLVAGSFIFIFSLIIGSFFDKRASK